MLAIARVHQANYGAYGARKVWLALNREGIPVARCTVERLMGVLGLVGARLGATVRTTRPDPAGRRAPDLVRRRFTAVAPDRIWVADFSYVATWAGFVYVAFVLDAFSRRILGWKAATTMRTELVLDALEQAIWTRAQAGVTDLSGLVHHSGRRPGRIQPVVATPSMEALGWVVRRAGFSRGRAGLRCRRRGGRPCRPGSSGVGSGC
jgi:putative transposase